VRVPMGYKTETHYDLAKVRHAGKLYWGMGTPQRSKVAINLNVSREDQDEFA